MVDETSKTDGLEKVYLVPMVDGTWKTMISDTPPTSNAAFLSAESPYPAKVYYSRIDLNGSSTVEMDICHNRDDLVQALNWIGQCGHPLLSVWEYDHKQSMESTLIEILNRCYERGFRQRQQALAEIEDQTSPKPLKSLISKAKNKVDAAPSARLDKEPYR